MTQSFRTKNRIVSITVTEDDIRKGVRHSPSMCPIARAAKRQLKRRWVDVDALRLTVILEPNNIEYRLSPSATDFIERFDDCETVAPFSFEAHLV